MNEYILISIVIGCFVLGVFNGAFIMWQGYKMGWKASYEIRSHQEESAEGKGLFPPKKDPAEFDLLEETEKENEEI